MHFKKINKTINEKVVKNNRKYTKNINTNRSYPTRNNKVNFTDNIFLNIVSDLKRHEVKNCKCFHASYIS